MKNHQQTTIPSALPTGVAWVPTAIPQPAPAAPTKPAPAGLHPAIVSAAILVAGLAIYAATAAGVDAARAARLSNLENENASLQAQLSTARSAKAAYCSAGGTQ